MKELKPESLRKKRLNLINNTINHYKIDNRALESGKCRYRTSDGKACAIGREIKIELANKLDNLSLNSVDKIEVFKKLPIRLKRLGISFLKDVQILHDSCRCWTFSGLSNEGKIAVKKLIKKYNLQGD